MTTRVVPLFVGDFLGKPGMPLLDGQRIVVIAYVVERADITLLFDTGIAPHLAPEDEAAYRFERRPVVAALESAGIAPSRIDAIVNCHLHADHAGGNDVFRGRPIWIQRADLEAAAEPGFTEPAAADLADGTFNVIDGPAEIAEGPRDLADAGTYAGPPITRRGGRRRPHRAARTSVQNGVRVWAGPSSPRASAGWRAGGAISVLGRRRCRSQSLECSAGARLRQLASRRNLVVGSPRLGALARRADEPREGHPGMRPCWNRCLCSFLSLG